MLWLTTKHISKFYKVLPNGVQGNAIPEIVAFLTWEAPVRYSPTYERGMYDSSSPRATYHCLA